jgi:hypothetical protein
VADWRAASDSAADLPVSRALTLTVARTDFRPRYCTLAVSSDVGEGMRVSRCTRNEDFASIDSGKEISLRHHISVAVGQS